ncbi:MAG: trigger factor [Clostridia bacterium]|nr:trigger factor [Clostridia bacterium]
MKYKFEKAEKNSVKIHITLDAKEWQQARENAYNKTKGQYSMQGFRKGKVPMKVLENAYGVGIFFEDAINDSFPKYYGEVLDKEPSIEVIARPNLEIEKITEKGITLLVTVPVKPEVKLGAYKGIKFDKVEYNVEDKDIEEEIKRLRERNSRLIDVTDRACENGDNVIIDYSGSVDGVKFDGGTAEKQPLTLGSGQFIPGFEDQVVGMAIGEERDILVKFPEEYHAENLKGKDAVFHVKLHEIKKTELPEVNDEFIKEAAGAESLEAYKAETKERLEKMNADRAERELENKMIKFIADDSQVELNDSVVEDQIDSMVQDMEYRMMYQGLKLEDYLKYMNITMTDYRKNFEGQAREMLKSQFVIGAILDAEKIDASEEEIQNRINEMAEKQGKKPIDVSEKMDTKQVEYIKNDIIIKKLFDFLKKENEIK